MGGGFWIEYTPHKNEVYTITSDLSKININSFVLPIRPKDKKTKFISAKAKLLLANNETIEILSNYKIHSSGGTLLFLVAKTDFEIKKVSFEFNDNVEILYITKNPSILWFGEGKERE